MPNSNEGGYRRRLGCPIKTDGWRYDRLSATPGNFGLADRFEDVGYFDDIRARLLDVRKIEAINAGAEEFMPS